VPGKAGCRGWGHVRRERSGRWSASYVGPDGNRHRPPMTFERRVGAEGWLVDERRALERDRDAWLPPAVREAQRWVPGETVGEYGSQHIAQRRLKPGTRDLYESLFSRLVVPVLGGVPVRGLTSHQIRHWYAGLDSAYRSRNGQAYALVHSIMETAVEDGLVQVNPCQIKGVTNPPATRQAVILTVEELATVADTVPERYRALVLLSAWCGLRFGEITELRRRDIGAGCETVSVARAVTHRGGCRIDTPKSGKARNVVVPPHIRLVLKHHLDMFTEPGAEALVFAPARGGCHLANKVFARALRPALKDIGREDMHVHGE
jgi:integrase